MVRLRNVVTGVIVNVRDGKVLAGYVPAEEPEKAEAPKRAPAVRNPTK
jgi:hypothetical protein